MNKFKYSDNKLWLVIPEPEGNAEDYELGSHWNLFWFKKWEAYNSRLSYSLSKELRDKLKDGEVLNENEFMLGEELYEYQQGTKWIPDKRTIAIPLKEPERLFTLSEMIECWRSAETRGDQNCELGGNSRLPDRIQYFKETFGINL